MWAARCREKQSQWPGQAGSVDVHQQWNTRQNRNGLPIKVQRSSPIHAITDGRAGNVRQAVALARALQPGPVTRLALQPRAPWRWAAPRQLPGAERAYGSDFANLLEHAPALAIGCGRQAALALRQLRARGSAVVQILNPRINPRHWDLVITPEHDNLRGANVLSLQGSLNPVNDEWLAWGRAAFAHIGQLPGPRTAVLVGGPTDHARWDEAAMSACFAQIAGQVRAQGGSVLATTSRRTPPAVAQAMLAAFANLPRVIWSDGGDGTNPYAGLLGWADQIVVTPDSVNLLSEACATRAPVCVLLPGSAQGRMARFQRSLHERGRLLNTLAALGDGHHTIEPLRETGRIAAEVRTRLGR